MMNWKAVAIAHQFRAGIRDLLRIVELRFQLK